MQIIVKDEQKQSNHHKTRTDHKNPTHNEKWNSQCHLNRYIKQLNVACVANMPISDNNIYSASIEMIY